MQLRLGQGEEMLSLARLACQVPPEIDDAPVFAAVAALLTSYQLAQAEQPESRLNLVLLVLAATVAKTPDVPLPAIA